MDRAQTSRQLLRKVRQRHAGEGRQLCWTADASGRVRSDTSNLYDGREGANLGKTLRPSWVVETRRRWPHESGGNGGKGSDLGYDGGIDVYSATKAVGTTGRPYGLDMTDEMLRAN